MRKLLTMFAALIMAATLIVPAYAANTEYTYTDTSEYVYLEEGATLYYNPGESSAVYGAVSAALASEQVEVVRICNETGQLCIKHSGVYVWVASEDASATAPMATGDVAEADDSEEGVSLTEKLTSGYFFALYLIVAVLYIIMGLIAKEPLSHMLWGSLGIMMCWSLNLIIKTLADENWIAWLVFAAAFFIVPIVKLVKRVFAGKDES